MCVCLSVLMHVKTLFAAQRTFLLQTALYIMHGSSVTRYVVHLPRPSVHMNPSPLPPLPFLSLSPPHWFGALYVCTYYEYVYPMHYTGAM